MQLRLALSVPKFTGSGFNQTTSAILTGVTIAGAFSTLIFNSTTARGKVNDAFKTFAKLLSNTPIYSGAEQLAKTFKDWGTTVVGKKDDFKEWVHQYLNPEGFKSGAVELYTKLYDWATIVYEWFRDKFWPFIKNIPKMVENWKSLRLSLFKWGTFLGGGGGAALWSMFGSFDDFGKLADLMGNEEVMKAAEMFADLVGDNPDAFKDMGEENMKEILERIAEDPGDAQEIIKELKDQQEAMAKDKEEKEKAEKKREEEMEQKQQEEGEMQEKKEPNEEKPQLKQEQIMEAFKQAKGSPQSQDQVFGNLAGSMLQRLLDPKKSLFGSDSSSEFKAREAMQEYMKKVDAESKKDTKSGRAYKDFLESLGVEGKQLLMNELPKWASEAFGIYEKRTGKKSLKDIFEKIVENKTTKPIGEEDDESQAVNIKDSLKIPVIEKE